MKGSILFQMQKTAQKSSRHAMSTIALITNRSNFQSAYDLIFTKLSSHFRCT